MKVRINKENLLSIILKSFPFTVMSFESVAKHIPDSIELEAEPIEEWPKDGNAVWITQVPETYSGSAFTYYYWSGDTRYQKEALRLGLCFKTREEAIAKAKEIEEFLLTTKKG